MSARKPDAQRIEYSQQHTWFLARVHTAKRVGHRVDGESLQMLGRIGERLALNHRQLPEFAGTGRSHVREVFPAMRVLPMPVTRVPKAVQDAPRFSEPKNGVNRIVEAISPPGPLN